MSTTRAAVNPTDEQLASQAAAGSRPAYDELILRYSRRLFHFLRSRSLPDEDIEDLVQETFLKAYRNIGRFDPRRRFSTWLFTIAVRLSVSRRRSERERPLRLDPKGPEHPSPGPPESLALKEKAQEIKNVWSIAHGLKPVEYQVLWLRYAEEMPVKEIARSMKKTPVGVRVLLHRSRTKLGKKLREPSPAGIPAGATAMKPKPSIL